jgi:hypothetical protein
MRKWPLCHTILAGQKCLNRKANVTNAGIVRINSLRSLQVLNLQRASVTEEGRESLKQALPDCYLIL